MKTILFLLLSLLPLAAQQQIQVRIVSIEKPGAASSLEAAQPDCDEKLYASLIAEVAGGKAKIVHDQSVVVRSGQRSKTEAIREWPYCTESDIDLEHWVRYPANFTFYNLGSTLEVEATVGEEPAQGQVGRMLDINLAPEQASLLAMHPWPVPDFRGAGQMGRLLQPVIATHKLQSQILTWTGRTALLSVAASPGAAFQESTDVPFRYTFLRAGLDGEKSAPVSARPANLSDQQRRLHAVTFRMSRDAAATLLVQQSGDDAALYEVLCQQLAGGSATLSGHTAILVRQDYRSKIESSANFPLPKSREEAEITEWDYGFRPGVSLEVEAESGWYGLVQPDGKRHTPEPQGKDLASGPDDRWNLAYQSQDAPELVPWYPDATHPALTSAVGEYVERKWAQQVRIPESGVLCSTVLSTSPATDEAEAPGGLTDVCFLLQYPPPGPPGSAPQPHNMLHAVLLSVPAAEGPALAQADVATATGPLMERLAAGELHCAAQASIVIRSGGRSQVNFTRKMQQPGRPKPPHPGPGPNSVMDRTAKDCGLSLEAEIMGEGKDEAFNLALEWDTAPVLPFGAPGAVIPEISERRCVQKISLQNLRLTRGQPVIADVRASNAREGTAEHGRWHVLVLLAR